MELMDPKLPGGLGAGVGPNGSARENLLLRENVAAQTLLKCLRSSVDVKTPGSTWKYLVLIKATGNFIRKRPETAQETQSVTTVSLKQPAQKTASSELHQHTVSLFSVRLKNNCQEKKGLAEG